MNKFIVRTAVVVASLVAILLLARGVDEPLNSYRAEVDILHKENERLEDSLLSLQRTYEELAYQLSQVQSTIDWQTTTTNNRLTETDARLEELSGQRIVLSKEELNIFYRLIRAEGGTMSLEGQKWLASAVVNRILDDRWGSSISETITKPSQFSVMDDGAYYKEEEISEDTKLAVQMALYKDYSQGATHFVNLNISHPDWADKLKFIIEIDGVSFYK